MLLRRALSSLSVLAVAGTIVLIPTTASATPATLAVQGGTVTFSSKTTAAVTVEYTCGTAEAATQEKLLVAALQHPTKDDFDSYAVNADEGTPVDCDGSARTTDPVALDVDPGGRAFENGPGEVALLVGDDDNDLVFVDVDVVGVPTPQIALTVNASPEPARKGAKITVKGTVTRDGKALKKVKASLLFAKDGGEFVKIKTVKSDKKGKLSTKVKAGASGTYAYAYDGVTSSGDDIVVIPAVKKYKNCEALNRVYPSGVGKKGAKDKGGSVDDFTVDNATYAKNKKRDRDKDGIACEQ